MDCNDVEQKIQTVLDQLRPALLMHGGNMEFVSFVDGVVSLKFQGACIGCPASFMTLKFGVEQTLKEQVPVVTHVVAIE